MRPLEESNRLTTPGMTPRPLTEIANSTVNYCAPKTCAQLQTRGGGYQLTRSVLLAGVEEQLEAEADAEEGAVPTDVLAERFGHSGAVQYVHGGAEGAHPGEDETVRGEDVLGAPHVADAEAEVADGVAHAAHVPRAIVQQCDRCGEAETKRITGMPAVCAAKSENGSSSERERGCGSLGAYC
jgi:hypothetical protein